MRALPGQLSMRLWQGPLSFLLLSSLPVMASAAEPSFPRGPGFYFNMFEVLILLLAYLAWIKVCSWVDRDASQLDLPCGTWNGLLLGVGFAGLTLFFFLPLFWLALLLLEVLFVSVTIGYVLVRNQWAAPADRVLTKQHLQRLVNYFFGWKFRPKAADESSPGVPIRFLGRNSFQGHEDPSRMARAQQSKGYQSALKMVYEAITTRATDIHLEPTRELMLVRYRIDGILNNSRPFSRKLGDAVISIFKVLGNLDIAEKRTSQDGSFSAQVEDRPVDFRLATAGSVAGEKLVMRILDKSQKIESLTQLGMDKRTFEQIRGLVTQPHGMFIVCGPTGAGKSTTLHACLNEIDRFQKNIITIENPVEYQMENVTQIEVNLKAGKTFAAELRSILRQDPDVIMVGEIRDQETAEIACQAAQTGHMVFTTLHANDAVSALGRLIDLGVKPFMIASAISGILSQRLLRLLCPHCRIRYKPGPNLLRKAKLPADKVNLLYKAQRSASPEEEQETCAFCKGLGYLGRTGIFELLVINDVIRAMIREDLNLTKIKQKAIESGMRPLYIKGLRKVVQGETSFQELRRVSK